MTSRMTHPTHTRKLPAVLCCLVIATTSSLWAEDWAFDKLLTLSASANAVQTPEGPMAQLTASASLPREVVEGWTDEAMQPQSDTSDTSDTGREREPRGYRVCIQVLQGGKPVAAAHFVPGTGPLGDWVGLYPGELGDRVVWKRRAITKVTVLQALDSPPAEYTVTWYVDCQLARSQTVALPGGSGEPGTPPASQAGPPECGSTP